MPTLSLDQVQQLNTFTHRIQGEQDTELRKYGGIRSLKGRSNQSDCEI